MTIPSILSGDEVGSRQENSAGDVINQPQTPEKCNSPGYLLLPGCGVQKESQAEHTNYLKHHYSDQIKLKAHWNQIRKAGGRLGE